MTTPFQNQATTNGAAHCSAGAGLYFHIPFCQKKCDYCDFYSITQVEQIDRFVDALLKEIEMRAPRFKNERFSTVFFGGGTPSLLSAAQLSRIWQKIRDNFQISPDAECSIESNPGTLDAEKLAAFRETGFNRLSMGVQSFNAAELEFLGRIHSVEDVFENFENARNAGFSNINIDLMTAFPGISRESFLHSLNEAASLKPAHIACYTLIFEPGTVFYKRMERGELQPLQEEKEAEYYEMAAEILAEFGYRQYEVSNFARGKENVCRHNLIYWKHQPYAGFGPSAHSFHQNARSANKRSLMAYLHAIDAGELAVDFREELSPEQLMFEYIFLNLRLKDGLDLHEFRQRFGVDFLQHYHANITRLSDDGVVEFDERAFRLSPKGWLLADAVATYF